MMNAGGGALAYAPSSAALEKAAASSTRLSNDSTLWRPRRGSAGLRPWPSASYVCTATPEATSLRKTATSRARVTWHTHA
jgi:hypothetical protein